MISVVVGLYNEEEVLPLFIKSFFENIDLKEKFELLLVNDGSKDKTEELIKKAAKKHKEIKVISYTPNKGLGNALRTGFKNAKGRIIVTMDSDLAHPSKYISKLISRVDKGNDLVIGSRYSKGGGIDNVPYQRDLLSRLTNIATKIAVLSKIKDMTCGFRAYRSDKLKKIRSKERGFEVELELLVKFIKMKAKISEVPFRSIDRPAGKSKFRVLKDGPDYIKSLCKIMIYRWL